LTHFSKFEQMQNIEPPCFTGSDKAFPDAHTTAATAAHCGFWGWTPERSVLQQDEQSRNGFAGCVCIANFLIDKGLIQGRHRCCTPIASCNRAYFGGNWEVSTFLSLRFQLKQAKYFQRKSNLRLCAAQSRK